MPAQPLKKNLHGFSLPPFVVGIVAVRKCFGFFACATISLFRDPLVDKFGEALIAISRLALMLAYGFSFSGILYCAIVGFSLPG